MRMDIGGSLGGEPTAKVTGTLRLLNVHQRIHNGIPVGVDAKSARMP